MYSMNIFVEKREKKRMFSKDLSHPKKWKDVKAEVVLKWYLYRPCWSGKIIRIILSKEGLQIPYIYQVLS